MLMLSTTLAAMLVAMVMLAVYEARSFSRRWIRDLSAQAEILGRASAAAIVFDDPEDARRDLEMLQVRSGIFAAAIYDAGGNLYARYIRPGGPAVHFPAIVGKGYSIHDDRIEFFKAITKNNQMLGTIYLLARYGVGDHLAGYFGIIGAVVLISVLAAGLIWVWLEKAVTQPIRDVTDVARRVMEWREYTLPMPKTSDDEISYLVDAFNKMLTQIRRSADALLQADRMKDQFLATLAHELRNPLAPISNALHMLEFGANRPELAASAREIMTRQLKQLVRLVDDLLDVSRIATGKLVLHTRAVELHGLVEMAVEIARPLIDGGGHHLQVILPPEPVHFVADETRVAQVLSTLLNNAARYTDPGGDIVLRAAAEHGEVAITVVDNGRGMSSDLQRDIFKMFTQGEPSLNQATAGLGVGLALAKRLVELHDGTIEVYSAGVGRGSRFTVRLPRRQEAGGMAREIRRASAAAPISQHILVVDDNQDFASSLGAILGARGHRVRVEHTGVGALAVAAIFRPSLVFLDIGLPDMSGNDVAQRLRLQFPEVLLVAISGWGQEVDKQTAAQAGFDRYIVKPLSPSQLDPIIRSTRQGRERSGAPAPRVSW